jgi:hypothetical protein
MKDTELAWLAGILEGEGSFLRPAPSAPNLPLVRLSMTDRDVVERAAKLVGAAVTPWTPPGNPRHKTTFIMSVRGTRARELMLHLRPLMGRRRREQIDRALAASNWRRGDGPKITLVQARDIRDRFVAGESAVALAAEFGVSKWLVYRIREGKRAS